MFMIYSVEDKRRRDKFRRSKPDFLTHQRHKDTAKFSLNDLRPY